ncbi:hypothetical protein COOONC_11016, partial [Cooperia oncophora]
MLAQLRVRQQGIVYDGNQKVQKKRRVKDSSIVDNSIGMCRASETVQLNPTKSTTVSHARRGRQQKGVSSSSRGSVQCRPPSLLDEQVLSKIRRGARFLSIISRSIYLKLDYGSEVEVCDCATGKCHNWIYESLGQRKSCGEIFRNISRSSIVFFSFYHLITKFSFINGQMEPMERAEPEVLVKPAFAEPNLLAIVVAAIVVFLTVAFFFYRSLKSKADTFLLVGLSDSGKTHIFGKIANKNNEPVTYTSFQENVLDIDVKG